MKLLMIKTAPTCISQAYHKHAQHVRHGVCGFSDFQWTHLGTRGLPSRILFSTYLPRTVRMCCRWQTPQMAGASRERTPERGQHGRVGVGVPSFQGAPCCGGIIYARIADLVGD